MLIQGQVGPISATSSIASGTQATMRQGNMGDQIISNLHDRNYEAVYRRAYFAASQQAVIATATVAGVGTTITGAPVLYNPIGSGVNVVISKVGLGFCLAPAAPVIFGIATGFNSTTAISGTLTSVTPKSRFVGQGAAPLANLYISASITLPTASTVDQVLGTLSQGAVNTTTIGPGGLYAIDGSIILPPGGYAHFWSHAVLLASCLISSWSWEEVPI
jgi:hypothetical protein